MDMDTYKNLLVKTEVQERILLGFMILDPECTPIAILDYDIHRNIFWYSETRAVFCALEEMFNAGLEIAPETVYEYMLQTGLIREINGVHTLNNYLFVMQWTTQSCPDYTIDYVLNSIIAMYEQRQLMLLQERYNIQNFLEGEFEDESDSDPLH